eukprot:227167_1
MQQKEEELQRKYEENDGHKSMMETMKSEHQVSLDSQQSEYEQKHNELKTAHQRQMTQIHLYKSALKQQNSQESSKFSENQDKYHKHMVVCKQKLQEKEEEIEALKMEIDSITAFKSSPFRPNITQKDESLQQEMEEVQKEKEDEIRRLEAELKAHQVSLDAKQKECAQKQEQLQSVQIENEQYLLEKEGLKLTCRDNEYQIERQDERYSKDMQRKQDEIDALTRELNDRNALHEAYDALSSEMEQLRRR